MDTLRISLIAVGLLLILVIYVFSKSKQQREKEQKPFGDDWLSDDPLAKEPGEITLPSIKMDEKREQPVDVPSMTTGEPPEDLVEEFERLAVLLRENSSQPTVNPQATDAAAGSTETAVNAQITDAVESTTVNPMITDAVTDEPTQPEVVNGAVVDSVESATAADDSETQQPMPEVVVLHVMATEETPFHGKDLKQAILATGMIHGDMDIFHAYTEKAGKTAIFSLINSVEPGTFNLVEMDEITTPGVSLFMQLPLPVAADEVFDTMYYTAKMLADKLGGKVMDKYRQPLTEASLQAQRQQLS